jgi:hypothetical protein
VGLGAPVPRLNDDKSVTSFILLVGPMFTIYSSIQQNWIFYLARAPRWQSAEQCPAGSGQGAPSSPSSRLASWIVKGDLSA